MCFHRNVDVSSHLVFAPIDCIPMHSISKARRAHQQPAAEVGEAEGPGVDHCGMDAVQVDQLKGHLPFAARHIQHPTPLSQHCIPELFQQKPGTHGQSYRSFADQNAISRGVESYVEKLCLSSTVRIGMS